MFNIIISFSFLWQAAMGILTYARQNLRVELKESWYEHLSDKAFIILPNFVIFQIFDLTDYLVSHIMRFVKTKLVVLWNSLKFCSECGHRYEKLQHWELALDAYKKKAIQCQSNPDELQAATLGWCHSYVKSMCPAWFWRASDATIPNSIAHDVKVFVYFRPNVLVGDWTLCSRSNEVFGGTCTMGGAEYSMSRELGTCWSVLLPWNGTYGLQLTLNCVLSPLSWLSFTIVG